VVWRLLQLAFGRAFFIPQKEVAKMKISMTKGMIAAAATGGRCWYCGIELELITDYAQGNRQSNWFVLDHVIPRSLGGTNDQGNLVASCWRCNNVKNNKTLEQYRAYLVRLAIGMPHFNQEQLAWLAANGFVMPAHEPVVFWAEKPENLAVRA
jgi:hypothetical protein